MKWKMVLCDLGIQLMSVLALALLFVIGIGALERFGPKSSFF